MTAAGFTVGRPHLVAGCRRTIPAAGFLTMRLIERIKLAAAIVWRGEGASLDWLESELPAKPKPEPQEYPDGWFRQQALLRFERQRADKRERSPHITHHNYDVGWRDSQLPARWWQDQQ